MKKFAQISYIFYDLLLKLIFTFELFKIKICRVEVDELLDLKSNLVKIKTLPLTYFELKFKKN
jgi:hypothetical protein